jgi:hypothetical protein
MIARKLLPAIALTITIILLLSSISIDVVAQDVKSTNQNTPCQAVNFQDIANRVSPTLNSITLKTKSSILPDGEIVEVEISKPSPKNILFCVKLRDINQIIDVLRVNSGTDGNTKLTFKLPKIGWNTIWRQMRLELVSFPLEEQTGNLQINALDTYLLQDVYLSSWPISVIGAIIFAGAAYVLAGIAVFFQNTDKREWNLFLKRYLNPVVITSGEYGKASLSNLQIFWFTLLVLGLLFHVLLRTGTLSPLSQDILLLMGISAAGKTLSTGVDATKARLSSDNLSWVIEKGLLKTEPHNNAHWRDLILTDNSLDVYRYQLAVFSFLVGVTLMISGLNVLSTYALPEGFATLLGLSNVVYIFGKAVSPSSVTDLNHRLDNLRITEQELSNNEAGVDAKNPAEIQQIYNKKLEDVKRLIKSLYSL